MKWCSPVVLLGMAEQHWLLLGAESHLAGRRCEMSLFEEGLFKCAHRWARCGGGRGRTAGHRQESPRGREAVMGAATPRVDGSSAFCESHTSQVPFHAVARLLRAITGIKGLDGQTARDRVRARVPGADPEDLLLLR